MTKDRELGSTGKNMWQSFLDISFKNIERNAERKDRKKFEGVGRERESEAVALEEF